MPLNPDVIERAMERGEPIPFSRTEARFIGGGERRINAPAEHPALRSQTVKALVILVTFTNNPPGGPTTRYAPAVFDSMLFGHTYVRGGADPTTNRTLKNYYNEVSYGTVNIVTLNMPGSVGWVSALNAYSYYCQADGVHDNGFGPWPRNAQGLVRDAVLAADPYVDFSQYAVGGVVQNLFIVHSGSGAEWNGDGNLIWSHMWSVGGVYVDGVEIVDYSMEPECGGNTTGVGGPVTGPWLPTVGVYAHEFGHVLGLPDEYDYGYESYGTGRFSLMAGGSWNRSPNLIECNGNSPAHPSPWGRSRLGFVAPVEVTGSLLGTPIPPIETTSVGALYKMINPSSAGKEYWLVENRQQTGFDEGLIRMTADAHGIVIYHVDENVFDRTYWQPNEAECVSGGTYMGTANCNCATLPPNSSNGEKWYGISVEQADGLYQMELNTSSGFWQDFYNSITGMTAFTEATTPNTTSYYGCATSIAVTGVSGSIGTMTSNLFGPTSCQVSPASIDFGTVFLGDVLDRTFAITNQGGGVLSGTVAVSCSDYAILAGGGSYNLSAGQTVAVTVRFAPTSTGTKNCTVATGSALCGGVPLTGLGDNPPVCAVSPAVLDFGTVTVGSVVDTSFTVTNTGGGTLTGSVSEACSQYSVVAGGDPYSLTAGQQVTVTVRFEPSAAGTHECAVETGSAPCTGVFCTGVGENPPACLVEPATIDFGIIPVGAFADTTFTITNTGGGSLSGEVSEACMRYEIVSGLGPYSLGAGQMRSVIVRFAPDSVGTHDCTVETGTGPCGAVTLTGIGGVADAIGHELTSGPTFFRLAPDTQNPLRPGDSVAYELSVDCHVRLEVYSAQGRRLATLIDGDRQAGRQTARWDGRSSDGTEAPSGVCFFRMQAGSFVTIKKMVLIR